MMFKIEGDNIYINVYAATDYSGGSTGAKATVALMPEIANLIRRLEVMEREWQEEKNLINSNPAVKASYEQYQQMIKLAKEYPNVA